MQAELATTKNRTCKNRSCWTTDPLDLTSHGAYQFLKCLQTIGSHWWHITKDEAEEVHTEIDEEQDRTANLVGLSTEALAEGEEGEEEEEGGEPETGEHQEGGYVPEYDDPAGLEERLDDQEEGEEEERQEGEEEYEEVGEGDESYHEELLDAVDDEGSEEMRNEPCDDHQAETMDPDSTLDMRIPTPLERIEEEDQDLIEIE